MAVRVRILSANVWNGRADPDRLAAQIEALRVDVACFQELAPDQAEAVSAVLPHGRLEPASDHNGMGIALRCRGEPGSLALRHRSVRTVRLDPAEWPGLSSPVEIWNIHIQAPHSVPAGLVRRRSQLRGLLRHLARAPGRLVVVGDFNATPLWPVYRRVAAQLRDAAREVADRRGQRPRRTWTPFGGARHPRLLRIDHVFLRGVLVDELRVVDVVGSDHDALVADVALEPMARDRSGGESAAALDQELREGPDLTAAL